MRHIAEISEHEMVALFLKTEIASARWGPDIIQQLQGDNVAMRIVDHPDITTSSENEYRVQLMGALRGYRRNEGLFESFPERVTWARVTLTQDELWQVKYIDYDYWVELSKGSRLATDAARTISAGEIVFEVPNDGFLALANALRDGATFPELIVVCTDENSDIVILEGHMRLTAYALVPEVVPAELPVVLGTSPDMVHWDLY
jgi:hypothetical protein